MCHHINVHLSILPCGRQKSSSDLLVMTFLVALLKWVTWIEKFCSDEWSIPIEYYFDLALVFRRSSNEDVCRWTHLNKTVFMYWLTCYDKNYRSCIWKAKNDHRWRLTFPLPLSQVLPINIGWVIHQQYEWKLV